MSKETREKMSDAHKGRLMTVSHKAAINARIKRKARSPEARAAISVGLMGKTLSCPEARAAISAAISASKKGKARSNEAWAAISDGMKAMKKAVIITLLIRQNSST